MAAYSKIFVQNKQLFSTLENGSICVKSTTFRKLSFNSIINFVNIFLKKDK